MDAMDVHSIHSTLRENIVEHIFCGELLRYLWEKKVYDAEILKSEFDAGGYDLVLSYRKVIRHIQMKVSREGGARANVGVNLRLSEKPSGCVIWIIVNERLQFQRFLWFGGAPGEPLPSVETMKLVKHTKANAQGTKAERQGHREVNRRCFSPMTDMGALLQHLLGMDVIEAQPDSGA
jgi:hypothetical protein